MTTRDHDYELDPTDDEVDSELAASGARLRLAAGSAPAVDPAADLARRWDRRRRRPRQVLSLAAALLLVGGIAVVSSGSGGTTDPTTLSSDAAADPGDDVAAPPTVDATGTTAAVTTTTASAPAEPEAPTTTAPPVAPPTATGGTVPPAPVTNPEDGQGPISTSGNGPGPTTTTIAPPPTTTPPVDRPVIAIDVLVEGRVRAGSVASIPGYVRATGAGGRATFDIPAHWELPISVEVTGRWTDPEPFVDPTAWNNGCLRDWSGYQRINVAEDGGSVTLDLVRFAWMCPPEEGM